VILHGDGAAAHLVLLALCGVALSGFAPARQLLPDLGVEEIEGLVTPSAQLRFRLRRIAQHPVEGLSVASVFRLALRLLAVLPHRAGDLREVALAPVRQQGLRLVHLDGGRRGRASLRIHSHRILEGRVEPIRPGVVPLAGDSREDGDLMVGALELPVVPPPLLAHIPKRVGGAPAIELVQDDHVGQVQHVDLLELRGRTVLGRHHVDRCAREIDDLRIALPDPGGLDEDEVEVGGLEHRHGIPHRLGEGQVGLPRGQRAHVDARSVDRVHADPVRQQGASRAAPGGIDQQEPHRAIGMIDAEAPNDLVQDAGLARAARPGEPEHRSRITGAAGLQAGTERCRIRRSFPCRDL
jgi:hypothetical protein